MSEKNNQYYGTDELKGLLRKLPREQAPHSLNRNIMRRIGERPPTLLKRITQFFSAPRTLTLHPIRLVGGFAALGLAFWLGLTVNTHDTPFLPQSEEIDNLSIETGQDSQTLFLQGRHLLVAGQKEQALTHLREAGRLAPENPEYAYYEGLAYQATDNLQLERASYQRGLTHAIDSLPLLLNLGHNFLDSGELDAALAQYDTVLVLNPQEATALYNRGLIYKKKGQRNREIEAWQQYLSHHRSGKWPLRAVTHLNNLGDFSFRSYQLGVRKIVLCQQALLGESDTPDEREQEIKILALLLLKNPNLDLNIVTFQENNLALAKSQAQELKKQLLVIAGKEAQPRIRLSWFGESETLTTNTNTYQLAKGVLLFGSNKMGTEKERRI